LNIHLGKKKKFLTDLNQNISCKKSVRETGKLGFARLFMQKEP
jgi:hypothetical protein